MRLVAASVLMADALPSLRSGTFERVGSALVALLAGVLLVVGLWTPVIGMVVAVLGFWAAATQPGDPWAKIQLATFGAALALLGPGAWSIDARLFGWKRIEVRDRPGQLPR
jgi:uncharacterized membrane protein YphA (DoxX/SURF4 family)